ncbi:MAG: hypothetical protein WDZ85_01270 [Candidatus Paceibacterota bacterium]
MSKTTINFKIDTEIKEEAQKLARKLGLPLSAIVNAQLHELLRTRTLTLSAEPRMTPQLERIIADVESDRQTGANLTKTYSLKKALAHLDRL